MMRSRLICEGGLRATEDGLSVEIRLPWYRSLPLTSFELVKLVIDGETIPNDSLYLEVNDQRFPVTELKSRSDDWWFVLDSGFLRFAHEPLDSDKGHEVEVTVALSPPYIKGLRRMTGVRKTLALTT